MNSPPQTTDPTPQHEAPAPVKVTLNTRPKKFYALLVAGLFAALVVSHLPLINLPYFRDEAGYFIPAARDIYLTGDPVPASTLSKAHPPLVMSYLALAWRLFGFRVEVARAAMLLVAALALAGLFRLSERVANRAVAAGTVPTTALYPVFFAQSSLAQLDTAAAALTFWGLVLYLPPKRAEAEGSVAVGHVVDESVDEFDVAPSLRRRVACVAVFALAALAKETAVLAAVAVACWEVVCWLVGRFRSGAARALCVESGRPLRHTLLWLLAPLPLAARLAYHRSRTGYFFGNPEYFRYNVASTLDAARAAETLWARAWQVTAHMNLWALTVPTVVAMFLPALRDAGVERRRIDVRVQLVFAAVVVLYVAALSATGGPAPARDMLPVVPLVILVYVSTLRRRVRRWRLLVAAACVAFVVGLFGE